MYLHQVYIHSIPSCPEASIMGTPIYRVQVSHLINLLLPRDLANSTITTNHGSVSLLLVPESCREAYWGLQAKEDCIYAWKKKM